jgi:phospho-N-acetylmuramoyl-pentapeptide-transferase
VLYEDIVVRELEVPGAITEQGEPAPVTFKDVKFPPEPSEPFFKNNELDYSQLIPGLKKQYTWVVYVLIVTFIVTAVSNATNLTDGLDGLTAGSSAIIGTTLAILAYLSGNVILLRNLRNLNICCATCGTSVNW